MGGYPWIRYNNCSSSRANTDSHLSSGYEPFHTRLVPSTASQAMGSHTSPEPPASPTGTVHAPACPSSTAQRLNLRHINPHSFVLLCKQQRQAPARSHLAQVWLQLYVMFKFDCLRSGHHIPAPQGEERRTKAWMLRISSVSNCRQRAALKASPLWQWDSREHGQCTDNKLRKYTQISTEIQLRKGRQR